MPNLLDANGFPEPGKPVLQNQKEDFKARIATVQGLNPNLGTGYLFHTTGTGALTVLTPVTSVAAGDIYTTVSPTTGSVGIFINTSALASVFLPYTGATADVNSNYNYISTDSVTIGTSYETPNSTTFTTTYPNITNVIYCSTTSGQLFDSFGDGFLYDSMFTQQATIDYTSGAIDTTAFNSYFVDYFDYNYTLPSIPTTTVSYNGSTFANGLIAAKNAASQAGYFSDDASNVVYLSDGTYAVNASGPSYFSGNVSFGSTARLAGFTVATLPAGTVGDTAYVTDALAPVYLTAVVGGGAVTTPVFFDGTNWVAN